MDISIKKSLFVLLGLASCLTIVHADPGKGAAFSWDPGEFVLDQSLATRSFAGNEQVRWQGIRDGSQIGHHVLMILAGVGGNFIGLCAGVYLANLDLGGGGLADPIVGGLVGSVCGSTLGVYLAGRAGGRRGNFGSALLGSLLGEVVAVALALAIPSEEFPFLAGFLVLPPIGAALLFNNSPASWSVRAGNGLFDLAEGKLGIGVPDIQVRPLFVPGSSAKPELQFNVRVLSVAL